MTKEERQSYIEDFVKSGFHRDHAEILVDAVEKQSASVPLQEQRDFVREFHRQNREAN